MYDRRRRMYDRRRRMYDRRRRINERSRRMYSRGRSKNRVCVGRLVRLAVLGRLWPMYCLVGGRRLEEGGWVGGLRDWGVVGGLW